MQSSEQPRTEIWSAFVRAALALGIVGGFGLGGLLFAAIALRLPLGAWWTAAAQAHGQVQVLGWAGLTVVGVALHFLPRLRGAAPSQPVLALPALTLIVTGLLLRLTCQPLLADPPAAWLRPAARLGLSCAGLFGILGATLALTALVRALADGPPLRQREGFRQVAPFLLVTFVCYWAANALTGAGLVASAWRGTGLVAAALERASTLLALYGFLWPICVAMSARLLPLHARTALPQHAALRACLACAVIGLALRLVASFGATTLDRFGQLLLAASLILAIAGLGVFAPRRPLPRPSPPIVTEPIQVAVLSAYSWLALTALLLGLNGLATLGLPVPAPRGETHTFGAGFVTILILGVGAALFPGFARRPLRSPRLLWALLLAANLAALARVLPPWLGPVLPPRLASAALAVAGLCGVLALLFFAANLAGPRPPATKPERNPT